MGAAVLLVSEEYKEATGLDSAQLELTGCTSAAGPAFNLSDTLARAVLDCQDSPGTSSVKNLTDLPICTSCRTCPQICCYTRHVA